MEKIKKYKGKISTPYPHQVKIIDILEQIRHLRKKVFQVLRTCSAELPQVSIHGRSREVIRRSNYLIAYHLISISCWNS